MCEKEGFIPRYYTDGPQDKVDKVLLDLQSYTHHLIDEETNLGQMLEHAINQIAQDKEKENRDDFDDDEDADLEEELFAEDSKKLIQDIDYAAFSDFEDSLEDMDNDFLKDILESGELDWH